MEQEHKLSTEKIQDIEILFTKTNKSMKRNVGNPWGGNKVKYAEFDSFNHINVATVTQFLHYKFMSRYNFLCASWTNSLL